MKNTYEFIKLVLASFVSQSGSYFLTIAITAFILETTGSLTKASIVFALTYLPSAINSAKLGNFIDRKLSKELLIMNEVLSIFVTILCGIALYYQWSLVILCFFIALRAILTFVHKTGCLTWIKRISPPETQNSRVKLNSLGFFLSTAVAGIMVAYFLKEISIPLIISIDIATYVISILTILFLNQLSQISVPEKIDRVSFFATINNIAQVQMIKRSFVFVVISQAIFQGAYTTLVSYLPISHFNIGTEGTGYFQLAASIGIILGFVLVWILPHLLMDNEKGIPYRGLFAGFIGLVALGVITTTTSVYQAIFMFYLMNFTYECIWLHHFAEFFRISPKHSIGQYAFVLGAFSSFVMSICVMGYAVAIDIFGLPLGVLSFLTILLAISIIYTLIKTKQKTVTQQIGVST